MSFKKGNLSEVEVLDLFVTYLVRVSNYEKLKPLKLNSIVRMSRCTGVGHERVVNAQPRPNSRRLISSR